MSDSLNIKRSAEISDCGNYRWWLTRSWAGGNGQRVCFVMLNPSTADGMQDDPTIRRCIDFAQRWGYSALSVRNLFPYRATDPRVLKTISRTVATGGQRGNVELNAARTADVLIAAWGRDVPYGRTAEAFNAFVGVPVYCLGTTAKGSPRHPLYVPKLRPLEPFWNCGASA